MLRCGYLDAGKKMPYESVNNRFRKRALKNIAVISCCIRSCATLALGNFAKQGIDFEEISKADVRRI